MASGSQNMTTYNARTVTGSNSAASPAGALLLSGEGRADDATGDTWIFLDSSGGTSTPWGIKHDQANNKIQIFGAGTNSVWTEMDTGNTYIGGSLNTGSTLTVRAQDDAHEGGEIILSPATDSFSTVHVDAYDSMFRLHDGTNERFKVDISTGNATINGNLGIGADYAVLGGSYKLYVNGSSFFNDHMYLAAEKHIYMSYDSTNYNILHNHNNGNISVNAASAGLYMGYYNTTFVNWMNGRMELRDGCLSLFPNNNAYRDGMRIHMFNSWSTITLCGADNTGNSGTSENSWFIGNNNGNFYIARNGSPGSTAYIGCVSNVWKIVTAADIPEGAANLSAAASMHTLSIYRNGITIPYQMDNVNDGGMLRVRGTAESNCILELGTWDDSGAGETIQFNYYPTTSQVTPTYSVSVPKHSGTLVTTDGYGASGTWGIDISGGAVYATSYLANRGSVSGSSHAEALKAYFNSYKASEPRNALVAHYSSASGNGSLCMGYFLSGYDSNPYGGFFVCHYNNPYYVGIQNGTYTQQHILTSTNYTSYTVTKTGSGASGTWGINITGSSGSCTGNAATASRATYANYLSNASHSVTIGTSGWGASNPWNAGNRTLIWGQYGRSSASSDTADMVLYYGTHANAGGAGFFLHLDGGVWSMCGIYTAVWNDFAEYRVSDVREAGYVVAPASDGKNYLTTERMQPGARIISDTFGQSVGYCDEARTPLGVSGRVLAYPARAREEYKIGDCVCASPGGKVDIMTREEIMTYPDRIIGIVNEIPDYDVWKRTVSEEGEGAKTHHLKTEVKGRIWIDIK